MFINTESIITYNNLNIYLDDLKFRLLKYTIETFINKQKNNDNKIKLFLKLSEYFEAHILLEFTFYKEKEYFEIKTITNSKIYNICKYFKNKVKLFL